MRIPHTICPIVNRAYKASPETMDLINEQDLKIDAQDLEWDNEEIPTLRALCTKKIAFYFEERPWYKELPCEDRDHLLELLSLSVPLEVAIPTIENEHYWRWRYDHHFGKVTYLKPKNWTWKSLYIEREVQKAIEIAAPQYNDEQKITDTFKLCAPYVKRLRVTQLRMWEPPFPDRPEVMPDNRSVDHIDFNFVFPNLPYLEEVELAFTPTNVGMNFNWDMFRLSIKDCQNITKAAAELTELRVLRIRNSWVEDQQCRGLMQNLIHNKTLVEIDLSNCRIGDQGALCIARVLSDHPTLRILNLNNNLIKEAGTMALAYAMLCETCPPLEKLFLSLNPLGREGAVGIMRAFVRGDIPTEVGMSAIQFEGDLPERIPHMLTVNNSIRILDVSANYFGEEGGDRMIEALEGNTCLEWLDMRETGITSEQALMIKKLLQRNRHVEDEYEEEIEEEEAVTTEVKVEEEDEDDL